MRLRVVSRVAERLKASGLRKLGNFKKIPEILLNHYKVLTRSPKSQIMKVVLEKCKKDDVNHFINKPTLVNLNFIQSFCPRFYLM